MEEAEEVARVRLPSSLGLLGLPRKVMSEKSAMGDRCAGLKLRGAVLSVFSVVDTA
jgi:hypothetical protein